MQTPETTITVYRGLTGPFTYEGGGIVFSGVSDQQLAQEGILANNLINKYDDRGRIDPLNPTARFVEGLPVFLTRPQAEGHLYGKRYSQQPALVEADINWRELFDTPIVRIIRNVLTVNETFKDEAISADELTQHLSGIKLIRGELYLQPVIGLFLPQDFFKGKERFFRPTLNSQNQVTNQSAFTQVNIPRT